jgi:biotin/methionine sulfoxide reductase
LIGISSSRRIFHAAHWGAFDAETAGGRLRVVHPAPADLAPSRLLESVVESVHSPLRIDRPYIRKGWLADRRAGAQPAGARPGGTPRGGEAFVPVDWDKAVRLIADEIARVRDTHGPASVFGGSNGWGSAGCFHNSRQQLHRLLACAGGFTNQIGGYSYAAGMTIMPHVTGTNAVVYGPVVDWRAIAAHAKVMLCFGGISLGNGQVVKGGGGVHDMADYIARAAQAGLRLVMISPVRDSLPGIETEWLPIVPNTDTALMLGMAHALLTEGLADLAFLARCTTGFDRLRAYILGETILGESDGVAKTPAWAAAISGIDAAAIIRLARDCAANPTMLTATWSLQRAEHGEQPFWMLTALGAMLGQIGQPGCGFSFGQGSMGGMGTPRMEFPALALPGLPNPVKSAIPVARITDMLENPGGAYQFNGQNLTYPDTRLIFWAGGNPFHHHQDLNRLLRAWARSETIIISEPWWTAAARHADIVLPATTTLERDDIASSPRDRFILAMHQAIAPLHQARSDFDAFADIAEALGVRRQFTEGRTPMDWLRAIYATGQANAAEAGIELPAFDVFWRAGRVEMPVPPAHHVPFVKFIADPVAAPLATPSGRIELFSAAIAGFGYDDCPGHPAWLPPREYLGAPRAALYPLHLLTPQPETRLHGQLDQTALAAATKINGREPVWLHPSDAAARGLAEGDIVRLFNDRGACLAGVRLTDGLRPSVAAMATGAWFDPAEPGHPGSLCVHGNPNVLTRDAGTSRLAQGPSPQSCLVEIERFAGPLPPVHVHSLPLIEA